MMGLGSPIGPALIADLVASNISVPLTTSSAPRVGRIRPPQGQGQEGRRDGTSAARTGHRDRPLHEPSATRRPRPAAPTIQIAHRGALRRVDRKQQAWATSCLSPPAAYCLKLRRRSAMAASAKLGPLARQRHRPRAGVERRSGRSIPTSRSRSPSGCDLAMRFPAAVKARAMKAGAAEGPPLPVPGTVGRGIRGGVPMTWPRSRRSPPPRMA